MQVGRIVFQSDDRVLLKLIERQPVDGLFILTESSFHIEGSLGFLHCVVQL